MTDRIPIVWGMETGDPDDFLTLLLLLGHPRVDLRAVTITPGTPDQVGVVRWALQQFERDLPVGAFNLEHQGACVSAWHHNVFGKIPASREALPGPEVLRETLKPGVTLVTGAALKNLGAVLQDPEFKLDRLVVQGGFAGEGVVPQTQQLPKFLGKTTCPSYNLNGDPPSVLAALAHPGIGIRRFVSKNVCHGVYYDRALHAKVAAIKQGRLHLELIWKGMEHYLYRKPAGKKFHDPLAACCAINETIASWAEVEIYREKGEWGSRLQEGTRTHIIVGHDQELFEQVLLA